MRNWHDHIKRHLLIWSGVALFGFLIGQLLWALLILAIIYTLRNYYQLPRFTLWLNSDQRKQPSEPPESYGIWGDIYDGIYRLQKQERSSSAHLENIINKAQESSAALEMAVIMINQHDNLDWWNKAAEKLLGFKFPQDKNQSINNLIRNPKFHDYFYHTFRTFGLRS